MKNPIIFALCLFTQVSLYSQSTSYAWDYIDSHTTYQQEYSSPHISGGVFAAYGTGSFDARCYLLNVNGGVVWSDLYNYGQAEYVVDATTDQSGNCYVLINTNALNQTNLGQHAIVRKYNSTGNLIYSFVYNRVDSPFPNENEVAYRIVVDADENAYVVGKHFHGNCTLADTYNFRIKISPSGLLLWDRIDAPFTTDGYGVCLSSFGRLYVSEMAQVREIDTATGLILNSVSLTYNQNVDGIRGMTLFPDYSGNVLVMATFISGSSSFQPTCAYIAKVNPTCVELWSDSVTQVDVLSTAEPIALVCDASDNIYLTQGVYTGPNSSELFVTKFDQNDQEMWRVNINSSPLFNWPTDLEIDYLGGVYLSSLHSNTSGNAESVLRKLDPLTGAAYWVSIPYPVGANNSPRGGIAVANTGDVYLTGYVDNNAYTLKFGSLTGVDQVETPAISVEVAPNPFVESVTLTGCNEKAELLLVQIFDVRGVVVFETTMFSNDCAEWDLRELSAGNYMLLLRSGNEVRFTHQLVKME